MWSVRHAESCEPYAPKTPRSRRGGERGSSPARPGASRTSALPALACARNAQLVQRDDHSKNANQVPAISKSTLPSSGTAALMSSAEPWAKVYLGPPARLSESPRSAVFAFASIPADGSIATTSRNPLRCAVAWPCVVSPCSTAVDHGSSSIRVPVPQPASTARCQLAVPWLAPRRWKSKIYSSSWEGYVGRDAEYTEALKVDFAKVAIVVVVE